VKLPLFILGFMILACAAIAYESLTQDLSVVVNRAVAQTSQSVALH
jgi:hypothetical protein